MTTSAVWLLAACVAAAPDRPPLPLPETDEPPTAEAPHTPEVRERWQSELRLGLAAGPAHNLAAGGTGAVVRATVSLHDLLPILDPQVLVLTLPGVPDAAPAHFGVGGRVTLPRFALNEFAFDLAVLVDTRGDISTQLGAFAGLRLLPNWQVNLFVSHTSASPIEAGVLSEGLELQYVL